MAEFSFTPSAFKTTALRGRSLFLDLLPDLFAVLGVVAVVVGVREIYRPAAFIVVGVGALAAAAVLVRRT